MTTSDNNPHTQEALRLAEQVGGALPSKASRPAQRGLLWKWLVLPALVVVAAFLMQRSVALLGLDLHHDTLMFDAARRLLNGELPFKDFFYQYNLGTVFFHALALEALGSQIASLKIATAVVYSGIAVLIYYSVTVAWHWRWALAAALVWSTLSPFYMPAVNGFHAWSTVYMMAAVMGGAFCLTIAITGRAILWALLAGVCFNLAFWFKQVAGLQILAVLVWILYNALRPSSVSDSAYRFRSIFVGIALGGLTSSIPFFVYLYQHSLFEYWWRSAFVFNGFFAASGNSSSGLIALARNFLPVNRELGYISVVWALLPLCLVAIVIDRHPEGGKRLFLRSDDRSLVASLFAALSVAGWIEYFPLAHSFHTQLFMAPMFVLLALHVGQFARESYFVGPVAWKSYFANKGRWPMIALLTLTMVALVYQAVWHLRGLRGKTSEPTVILFGEMPASGLRLKPDHALSYTRFYNTLLAANRTAADLQLIPMSVDPLRALIPIVDSVSADFKMGLNWTFPNEIVEPGFNKRLAMRIADRKSAVYADSLIGIPGYMPVALLEMPSPMTASHTLYVPSADREVIEPPTYFVADESLTVSGEGFQRKERAFLNYFGNLTNFSLVRLDNLAGLRIPSDDIADLHVSIIRSFDIPHRLSKFQFEYYLKAVPGELAARVTELYARKRNNRYELKTTLDREQTLGIAKFMLSQGKLFEDQDRPMFFTTMSSTSNNRPFLVKKMADRDEMQILWAKSWPKGNVSMKAKHETSAAYFLAFPAGVVRPNEEAILFVQAVMKDKTTRNFYLHYLPT